VSNSSAAWAVVAAALGAAVLTSAGAFGLEQVRERRIETRQRKADLRRACGELIACAQRLTHRSGFLNLTVYSRSGFSESLDIAMHHRKPIDLLELGDYLDRDFGPMLRAQSTIWMIGDEELISGATRVILAAGDVIAKSAALPPDAIPDDDPGAATLIAQRLKSFRSLKKDPAVEAARIESIRELGRSCWLFGQITRKRLGMDVDDLLRAFPAFTTDVNPAAGGSQHEE
jgi:hypothetical protein